MKILTILKVTLFLVFILFSTLLWADTHYASPTGTASWDESRTADAPCDLTTAWTNATAGDLVYLRGNGGTYIISGDETSLWSANHGTGDADSQRVIIRAYPGETPVINGTTNYRGIMQIDHDYWTIDGITANCTFNNESAGDRGCIYVGYNNGTTGIKIINNNLRIDYSASADNVDAIILKDANDLTVQYNNLEGYTTSMCGGLIAFGGIGLKVLNNEIHNLGIGIYQKHNNCDTGYSSGAEWAYNYIYNIGISNDGGFSGRGAYINIHDNIVSNPSGSAVEWGSDGGCLCCTDEGVIFNHNTLHGLFMTKEVGLYGTVKNNIINSRQLEASYGSWDYNIYPSDTAIGAHDQGNTSVTYAGGSNPSTIAGFALVAGSNGKNDGDDSKDLGADVTLVGMSPSDEAEPAPEGGHDDIFEPPPDPAPDAGPDAAPDGPVEAPLDATLDSDTAIDPADAALDALSDQEQEQEGEGGGGCGCIVV